MPKSTYSVAWVVWLQAAILIILFFTPGDLYNAVPVYIAQGYLLVTVSYYGDDYWAVRTATTVHIAAAVAAVVAAYATAVSTYGAWEQGRAYIHLGIMLAVSLLMVGSSTHVLSHTKID